MISYKQKLNNINTFIFDVDGVFTDGKLYLLKEDNFRAFNSKDGYAVQYAAKMGFKIFIITGGHSEEVMERLLGLGVTEVHLRTHNKLKCYNDILNRHSINDSEVLYMGDDIPDLPVLQRVGLSSCPQDAVTDIKAIVDYQSPYNGGHACVRDVIEQTLRVQGKWLSDLAFEW